MHKIMLTHLTGLQHHDYKLLYEVEKIHLQTEVQLVRDPENRFDENAIRVKLGGAQLGWIPKQKETNSGQAMLAALLDAGLDFTCKIVQLDATSCYIEIYIDKEQNM